MPYYPDDPLVIAVGSYLTDGPMSAHTIARRLRDRANDVVESRLSRKANPVTYSEYDYFRSIIKQFEIRRFAEPHESPTAESVDPYNSAYALTGWGHQEVLRWLERLLSDRYSALKFRDIVALGTYRTSAGSDVVSERLKTVRASYERWSMLRPTDRLSRVEQAYHMAETTADLPFLLAVLEA